MATILIVDDEPLARKFLAMVLRPLGHEVLEAPEVARAEELLAQHAPDLVFLDIRMPGVDGLSWLEQMQARGMPTQVVMMTGHGSVESAVRAMKLGAADYIEKPFDSPEAVTIVVDRVLHRHRLATENRRLKKELGTRFGSIIGRSDTMREVFEIIDRVAPLPVLVLIRGESGTGKELVARAVHQKSAHASKPFLAINCASVPETLLESTLFGHERGAFTGADRTRKGYFEEAGSGTLFLDEVGDMSPQLQARLLRVLQERRFTRVGGVKELATEARVIAATHRDLAAMVAEGTFREDLYYRLKVVDIVLPALKRRPGDVRLLASFFLERTARQFGRPPMSFAPGVLGLMEAHSWPGNVRELEHTIARMVALASTSVLGPADLPVELRPASPELVSDTGGIPIVSADLPLEVARGRFEEAYLRRALDEAGGNVSRAAERAGIARQHFHRKLKRYGIDTGDYKD
jgi:two-component system, NtrC family, nitrogen regulation response regulator NtrX